MKTPKTVYVVVNGPANELLLNSVFLSGKIAAEQAECYGFEQYLVIELDFNTRTVELVVERNDENLEE